MTQPAIDQLALAPMLLVGATLAALDFRRPQTVATMDMLHGHEMVEHMTSALVPMFGMYALLGLIMFTPVDRQ